MPPFRLSLTGDNRRNIAEVISEAERAGCRADACKNMREVIYRLEHEADEWGESRDDFVAAGLQARVGFCGLLIVKFAVHGATGLVFVADIQLDL